MNLSHTTGAGKKVEVEFNAKQIQNVTFVDKKKEITVAYNELKHALYKSKIVYSMDEERGELPSDEPFGISFEELVLIFETCFEDKWYIVRIFLKRCIDVYFHKFTFEQRRKLRKLMEGNERFVRQLKLGNKECILFFARFREGNSYIITLQGEDKFVEYNAFYFDGVYHITCDKFVIEKDIIEKHKIL